MIYPLIGKYCGFEIPQPIQTTSNQLFIVMNTDRYGGNGQGFLMEWETVPPLTAADRTTKTLSMKDFQPHTSIVLHFFFFRHNHF
jgi:CUB domain